nr:PREDICTED: zinc finger CCCH domain-containing protein 18-like [Bemisia tabaci]
MLTVRKWTLSFVSVHWLFVGLAGGDARDVVGLSAGKTIDYLREANPSLGPGKDAANNGEKVERAGAKRGTLVEGGGEPLPDVVLESEQQLSTRSPKGGLAASWPLNPTNLDLDALNGRLLGNPGIQQKFSIQPTDELKKLMEEYPDVARKIERQRMNGQTSGQETFTDKNGDTRMISWNLSRQEIPGQQRIFRTEYTQPQSYRVETPPIRTEQTVRREGTPMRTEQSFRREGTPMRTEESFRTEDPPMRTEESFRSGTPDLSELLKKGGGSDSESGSDSEEDDDDYKDDEPSGSSSSGHSSSSSGSKTRKTNSKVSKKKNRPGMGQVVAVVHKKWVKTESGYHKASQSQQKRTKHHRKGAKSSSYSKSSGSKSASHSRYHSPSRARARSYSQKRSRSKSPSMSKSSSRSPSPKRGSRSKS